MARPFAFVPTGIRSIQRQGATVVDMGAAVFAAIGYHGDPGGSLVVLARDHQGEFRVCECVAGRPVTRHEVASSIQWPRRQRIVTRIVPSVSRIPLKKLEDYLRVGHCEEYRSLWGRRVALVLEYHTALEVLALTPRHDQGYADRWRDVASVSERLLEAQRLEHSHHEHHYHS